MIDLDNHLIEKNINVLFDLIYSKYYLIKLSKLIVKIYFEKLFLQTASVSNLMKDLIQSNPNFYITSKNTSVRAQNADSLKGNDEDGATQKVILQIKNLDRILHINLKKYILKCCKTTLLLNLISNADLKSNKNQENLLDFMTSYMNLSLQLISCEECWEIKYVGVKLLVETIKVI